MRVYVSNLPKDATHNDLRKIFARHGKVMKAWIVEDQETGDSRGFGFVEMPFGDAQNAIHILNRSWFKNRRLNVQKGRFHAGPRKERSVYTSSRY